MSTDGRVGCPGAGEKPAETHREQGEHDEAVCPRCGGLYRLRADGRIRAHRVAGAQVLPMLTEPPWLRRARRTGTFTSRRLT